MQDVEITMNFDTSVDQLTKMLWVMKDNPQARDAASMYEKVLREEWEKMRRAVMVLDTPHDGMPEISEKTLDAMIDVMDEIKAFVIRTINGL